MKRMNLMAVVLAVGTTFGTLAVAGPKELKKDDRRDVERVEAIQHQFDAAVRARNRVLLSRVDDQLADYVQAELKEERVERRQGGWSFDRRGERNDLRRLRGIAAELQPLAGRTDRYSLNRRAELIDQLIQLAREELRENRLGRRVASRW